MRMIDADRLVDMLYDNEYTTLCPLDEVSAVVDACQTIDAVNVTRCKDCKYLGKELDKGLYSCNDYNLPYCEPDSYCSHGRRKEKEHATD